MGTLKIAILEKDGIELDTPVEMDLVAALAFIGITVSDNFSFKKVPLNIIKTIPVDQQMIAHEEIEIEGELGIEGELVLI